MAEVTLTSRGIGGGIVAGAGVIALLSAFVMNPVVGKMTKGPLVVDYADVLAGYFWWASAIGVALFMLGRRIARGKSRADGIAVLALMIGAFILFDRFLLARKGLPLWRYDPEVRYVHRPGVVRTLVGAGRPNDHVVINQWGHHDTEFSEKKPAGELRVLMLGDSVTMGFAVTYAETFSKHLEDLLASSDNEHSSHQVINAGVHGYSTFQEKIVFERSLRFEPDIVFIGFCMNDVTEPFVVDTEYGGTGLDYHGVSQTPNPFVGWLSNETGIGRFMQGIAARGKTREAEARLEIYNVLAMAQGSRTEPRMQEAWRILLQQLTDVYALGREKGIPVVLVIFPYTFQLLEAEFREPQAILREHAAEHGIDVIDTTDALARAAIDDPQLVEYLRGKGRSPEEVYAYHEHRMKKFFFDHDHFTTEGHAVVAGQIHEYLVANGYADAPPVGVNDPTH